MIHGNTVKKSRSVILESADANKKVKFDVDTAKILITEGKLRSDCRYSFY